MVDHGGETPKPTHAASETVQASHTLDRRSLLHGTRNLVMAGSLAAGYGTFFYYAGRFLYDVDGSGTAWQFLATVDELQPGHSMTYTAPAGNQVVVTRQGEGATVDDFVALSSVCPHLGCQVHWEPHNDRFFCPCHNGAFDRQGRPTQGPPADGDQHLSRFRLLVDHGRIFIEAPTSSVTRPPISGGSELA